MSHRWITSPFAALLAFTAAPAQTTWIVDAANGPGTSFTDLPPAIAAASDGDVVRVRPGTYTWTNISKGLRILGSGSGTVIVQGRGRLDVGPSGPTQSIWLEGLRLQSIASPATPSSGLWIQDSAGPVALRGILLEQVNQFGLSIGSWQTPFVLRRCAHVHLANYASGFTSTGLFANEQAGVPGIDAEDCFLELDRCQVRGLGGYSQTLRQPGGAAIRLRRCHAIIVDSEIIGAPASLTCAAIGEAAGGPGIEARERAHVVVYGRAQNPRGVVRGGAENYVICSFATIRRTAAGPGIALDASSARFEGVLPEGGSVTLWGSIPGAPAELRNGATIAIHPSTQPPIASIAGTPSSGSQVTLRLEAAPSATAFLVLGLEHRYLPLEPAAIGSLLLTPAPSAILGPNVLAGSTWDLPIDFVAGWPVDWPILAQFLVIEPNGVYASNAAALVLLSP